MLADLFSFFLFVMFRECLLEHQSNQRFYYNKATNASQWEPPQVTGDWIPAERHHLNVASSSHEGQVKIGKKDICLFVKVAWMALTAHF